MADEAGLTKRLHYSQRDPQYLDVRFLHFPKSLFIIQLDFGPIVPSLIYAHVCQLNI